MRRVLCLTCLLSVVLPLALAAEKVVDKLPDWAAGKMLAVNKVKQPITKVLQREGAAKNVLAVTNFFKFVDKNIQEDVAKQSSGNAKSGQVETRTCNMPDDDWQKAAALYLYLRGNDEADETCGTQREFTAKSDKADVRRAIGLFRPALMQWTETLNNSAAAIKKESKIGWNNPVSGVGRFVYPERDAQNCTVHHTLGVRVKDLWYVLARITAKAEGANADKGRTLSSLRTSVRNPRLRWVPRSLCSDQPTTTGPTSWLPPTFSRSGHARRRTPSASRPT